MHIKALVALLGLSLGACTGVIDGTGGGGGGGGDDTGGPGCGDGVVQAGESCDDGNLLDGDGCSAACSTEQQAMPRVTATVDKVTVNTELGKTEQLTVTFTSVEGFTGPVNLASTVDYGTATPSNWTITQSKPAATLVADGTDSITIDIAVPTDSAALAGTVKLDATSSVDPVALSSTLNVANQYTVVIPPGTGNGIPHAYTNAPNTLRIRMGASIVFDNQDTVPHRIHGDGGIDHEATGGGQPGSKYTQTPTGAASWYCHDHNESNAKTYNIQIVQ